MPSGYQMIQSRQYNLDSIRDRQSSPKIFIQIETGYIVAYQTRGKIGKSFDGRKPASCKLLYIVIVQKAGSEVTT